MVYCFGNNDKRNMFRPQFCFCSLGFFAVLEIRTQGFTLASPFFFFCDYFGDRVPHFSQACLEYNPTVLGFPPLLGWQHVLPCPAFFFFFIEMGIHEFFSPGLAWNCHPPSLSLLYNLGWWVYAAVPNWFKWNLENFWPQFSLPSHQVWATSTQLRPLKYFDLWLVESVDVKSAETEGQLYNKIKFSHTKKWSNRVNKFKLVTLAQWRA
jgi:hypothetical protein